MTNIIEKTGIPCSRYEGGENNMRVIMGLAYAAGFIARAGMDTHGMGVFIARLHDHKGDLYVVCRARLGFMLRLALMRAWEDGCGECAENVIFVDQKSREWLDVWESRRFESEWNAEAPPGE